MISFLKYTEKMKIKYFALLLLLLCGFNAANSKPWVNGLRTNFIKNGAYIYTLNVRTFGAQDYNQNDIIELDLGEVKGTFTNAIPKLKDLKESGINTIYLLPITKTGKLKALGTAGSLYAMDSFDKINPQLLDSTELIRDINLQAKKFVTAAHNLGMSVIVDLPSCGSYDMSLVHPELFYKDKSGNTVTPADWTDVRLFKVYNDDKTLNGALVEGYKSFVDMVQGIGADGIRADVAAIKPKEFWKEVIDYARSKDPEFLFLAEASLKWTNPTKGYAPYSSVEELLEAGFDGYYSDWADLKEIKTGADFWDKLSSDLKILNKFNNQKALIANFATHDQISPARLGYSYWQMVTWLNVTLPVNPYILDGFPSADTYNYMFANKKADKTYTDSDTYFVQNGKLDIYNFSRAPLDIKSKSLVNEYVTAVQLRYVMLPLLTEKETIKLSVNNNAVFAFKKQNGGDSIVVVGNLDPVNNQKVKVRVPGLKKDDFVMPFKMQDAPITKNGSLSVTLKPYEIQVLAVKKTLNTSAF